MMQADALNKSCGNRVSMAESPSSSCLRRSSGGRVQHLGPGFEPTRRHAKLEKKRDRLLDGVVSRPLMAMPSKRMPRSKLLVTGGYRWQNRHLLRVAPVLGWVAYNILGRV